MNQSENIRNASLMGGGLARIQSNDPTQYANRQKQYFDSETKAFNALYAKYASDFFEARAQGLNPNDRWAWRTVRMRMADVVRTSAAILREIDDFKLILIADADVNYIPKGTKFEAMGSTWLCTNPQNISGASGAAIIRRCNATWNYLDYYGNICKEPIIVANPRANASSNNAQETMLITEGYFNIIAQKNAATEQLNVNSRMLLGSGAWQVTGYSDFWEEFTGDSESVRLIEFAVHYTEPNPESDDLVNRVAGAKNFSWEIFLSGGGVTVGGTTALSAESVRNGETVEDSYERPVWYRWTSSDTSVATVDSYGNVTGVAEGTCTITATLGQNPAISATFPVTVAGDETAPHMAWTVTPDTLIRAYQIGRLGAALFENGEEAEDEVSWSFSGADESAYTVALDGNTAVITCWAGSITPLTVTAACGGHSISTEIKLEGI